MADTVEATEDTVGATEDMADTVPVTAMGTVPDMAMGTVPDMALDMVDMEAMGDMEAMVITTEAMEGTAKATETMEDTVTPATKSNDL